jgi:hypothetical protein
MKRSALPLVCGRNGRVRLCRISCRARLSRKAWAAIARAVVGEHPLDPNAGLAEPADGLLDRPRRALGAFVGYGHDDGIPAGVVDEHLEMLVAGVGMTAMAVPTAAEDAPAATVGHPAELLVVLVDERAGMAGDVADRGTGPRSVSRSRFRPARRRTP